MRSGMRDGEEGEGEGARERMRDGGGRQKGFWSLSFESLCRLPLFLFFFFPFFFFFFLLPGSSPFFLFIQQLFFFAFNSADRSNTP